MYSVDIDTRQLMAEGVYPETIFYCLNSVRKHIEFVGFSSNIFVNSWYRVGLKTLCGRRDKSYDIGKETVWNSQAEKKLLRQRERTMTLYMAPEKTIQTYVD